MDKRLETLQFWLENALELPLKSLAPASEDASFRRYFRIELEDGREFVAMDSPPDSEPLEPFIRIGQALAKQAVHVPDFHHFDITLGFMLLEDLGERHYLDDLPDNPDSLYQEALDALIRIQCGRTDQPEFALTDYDSPMLEFELDLFHDWYLQRHLGISLDDQQTEIWIDTKRQIIQACREQPQVWTHRDYHSRNLMVTPYNSPGVIDFQGMVLGPLGYDLASLFKDCYIQWPRSRQHGWLEHYLTLARQSLPKDNFGMQDLIRWVDMSGLQRHLKVLGLFCRLHHRDNKPHYLEDLPRVDRYVREVLPLYPELSAFADLFEQLQEQAA